MLEKNVDAVSALLKSIAHPSRLRILCLLQEGEKSVGDIHAAVHTTTANISQHLRILRHQGVVRYRKDANFIFNRIADDRVVALMNTLQELFCREDGSVAPASEPE